MFYLGRRGLGRKFTIIADVWRGVSTEFCKGKKIILVGIVSQDQHKYVTAHDLIREAKNRNQGQWSTKLTGDLQVTRRGSKCFSE